MRQTPEQFVEGIQKSPAARGCADRAEVENLAKHDYAKALTIARRIEHPWYRCQALSSIVEANPSLPNSEALLNEALDAAYSQIEPNRIVSVAFWPLTLLLKINPSSSAAHTEKLLDTISQEAHGLRRLDGLRAILHSVVSLPELRNAVLPVFLATARSSLGWRTERIVDDTIQFLAPYDREAAINLLATRPITRYTRRSRALLSQYRDSTGQNPYST